MTLHFLLFRSRRSALLIASLCLVTVACTPSSDDAGVAELPRLQEVPRDCKVEPFTQTLDQWLYSGDAFVLGTVKSLRPALDIAWVSDRYVGGDRLRDAAACDTVEHGFVIELSNSSVVQPASLSHSITEIYVGFDQYAGWDTVPHVSAEQVSWPAGSKGTIEEGMQIASLVLHETTTGRWGVPIAFGEPLFLMKDGFLQAQAGAGERCGANVPLRELEDQPVGSVIAKLKTYSEEASYLAAIKARKTRQNAENTEALMGPGTWFAHCGIPSSVMLGADCTVDADCVAGEPCVDGYCVRRKE